MIPSEDEAKRLDEERDEILPAIDYAKKLKGWAKWMVFWGPVNFILLGAIWAMVEFSGGSYQFKIPEVIIYISAACDIVAFIAGIACLAMRMPWPGFYVVFSLYLVFVGISNVFMGSGLAGLILGPIQIISGLWCIRDATRYSTARKAETTP